MNYRMKFPIRKILSFILWILPFVVLSQSLDEQGIPVKPNPPKLVNDYANLLSENNKAALESKLVAYNDSTTTQIAIVTVNNIGDYSIEDYAVILGRNWGIGQKDKNNGILILVSKEDRKVDIEIGYGLEGHITDYDSKSIIDNIIVPAFKQNLFYNGLDDATNRMIAQLEGVYKSTDYASNTVTADKGIPLWMIIAFIILFLIIISIIPKSGAGVSIGGGGWTWTSGGGGSSWNSGGGGSDFGGFGGGSFGGGGSSGSW